MITSFLETSLLVLVTSSALNYNKVTPLNDKQGRENKHLNLSGEGEKQLAEIADGKHQPDLPREAGKAELENLS